MYWLCVHYIRTVPMIGTVSYVFNSTMCLLNISVWKHNWNPTSVFFNFRSKWSNLKPSKQTWDPLLDPLSTFPTPLSTFSNLLSSGIFNLNTDVLCLRVSITRTKTVENGKVFSKITCIFGSIKPPRSGPSETALRLRSLPEGCPPQANFFLILDQNS